MEDAQYLCLKCGHEYAHKPRPTECPKCGHLYVKWLNYAEMNKKYFKN